MSQQHTTFTRESQAFLTAPNQSLGCLGEQVQGCGADLRGRLDHSLSGWKRQSDAPGALTAVFDEFAIQDEFAHGEISWLGGERLGYASYSFTD